MGGIRHLIALLGLAVKGVPPNMCIGFVAD
jgi:hypothetical protein